jgi:hypothetical protein
VVLLCWLQMVLLMLLVLARLRAGCVALGRRVKQAAAARGAAVHAGEAVVLRPQLVIVRLAGLQDRSVAVRTQAPRK